MIPRDTHDGAFYRAVLALHQDLFSLAQQVKTHVCPAFTRGEMTLSIHAAHSQRAFVPGL